MKFIYAILACLFLGASTADAGIFNPTRIYVPVYPVYPYTYYNYNPYPYYYNPYYYNPGPIFLDYRNVYQVPGFYYR